MRSVLPAATVVALLLGSSSARAQFPFGAQPGGGMPFGPPAPVATPPSPAAIATMQNLDRAKIEDSGRRLEWVWIDAGGGFEQLGLQTFNGGNAGFVAGLVKTSSSGGAVSAAVGARLLFLTFLLRGRVGVFDSGQLFRVGPEVGFHVPVGNIEPHVSLGVGYGAMANLHDTVNGAAAPLLALRGTYARVGAGVDFFLAPVFSLGVEATSELLAMFRPSLTGPEISQLQAHLPAGSMSNATLLASSGTGIGGTLAVTGVAALHF